METTINHTSTTADREITATRVFDAARELVWKVWTDTEHIIKWWGQMDLQILFIKWM
jgi:uncharacterized protein YndB with AHSA1/START domain